MGAKDALNVMKLKEIERREEALLEQVLSRLDNMERKIDSQSEQIKAMHEAFDLIMRDYFQTLSSSIEEAMKSLNKGGELSLEELNERIAYVKEAMGLMDLKTASLSSEKNQKLYEEITAIIRRELEPVQEAIERANENVDDVHRDINGNFGSLGRILPKERSLIVNEIYKRLANVQYEINQKIDSAAKETKIAANPNSRNLYYR